MTIPLSKKIVEHPNWFRFEAKSRLTLGCQALSKTSKIGRDISPFKDINYWSKNVYTTLVCTNKSMSYKSAQSF